VVDRDPRVPQTMGPMTEKPRPETDWDAVSVDRPPGGRRHSEREWPTARWQPIASTLATTPRGTVASPPATSAQATVPARATMNHPRLTTPFGRETGTTRVSGTGRSSRSLSSATRAPTRSTVLPAALPTARGATASPTRPTASDRSGHLGAGPPAAPSQHADGEAPRSRCPRRPVPGLPDQTQKPPDDHETRPSHQHDRDLHKPHRAWEQPRLSPKVG